MAKGREINFNLPSADDLFSTQEERDEAKREMIMEIPILFQTPSCILFPI